MTAFLQADAEQIQAGCLLETTQSRNGHEFAVLVYPRLYAAPLLTRTVRPTTQVAMQVVQMVHRVPW